MEATIPLFPTKLFSDCTNNFSLDQASDRSHLVSWDFLPSLKGDSKLCLSIKATMRVDVEAMKYFK